jgi:integrase
MVPKNERTYRFWVPVVALWIGARLNEVCRLEMRDVRSANGVDWMMVLDSKARGKNKGRKYPVPIHPELRRIGFMDHIKAMRERGERMLFPDAPIGSENGNAYQPVSKWFCRFLNKIGIDRDGVGMHSFRHSFVGATRDSDISANMSEALTGHKSGSTDVHKRYGGGPGVEALAEVMPKLTYRGLDLSHIYPSNVDSTR